MKVFIGFDPRQPVAFHVCAQSLWEHASRPVEIIRLELSKIPMTRRGLTEFTYSRFLVPYLSNFEGYSLFLDSDILVRDDVFELLDETRRSDRWNVGLVIGERKFEAPSVMLFNNKDCWKMTPQYVETENLYDLAWAKYVSVGKEWNHLVGYDAPNPGAKIVHFTKGIPIWKETINCEFAQEWIDTFKRMNSSVSFDELMGRSVHVQNLVKVAG